MALKRFPENNESNHPHYLWNNQEYIIRMLHQNRIGISISETSSIVKVSLLPTDSKNVIANGSADIFSSFYNEFPTGNTRWIYIKLDGSEMYISGTTPVYNQYLHGWYNNSTGDKAIIFIDSEQEAGYRCIVLDSVNALFEYNRYIPNSGYEELIYESSVGGLSPPIKLNPGNYRFILRGGKGGKGGNCTIFPSPTTFYGGNGAISVQQTLKITLREEVYITVYIGFDGTDGQDQNDWGTWVYSQQIISNTYWTTRYTNGAGAGGGSSGEDSIITIASGILSSKQLLKSYGGAGGGGATRRTLPINDDTTYESITNVVAPGGGGAGSGIADNGQTSALGNDPRAGAAGSMSGGGLRGQNSRAAWSRQGVSPSLGDGTPTVLEDEPEGGKVTIIIDGQEYTYEISNAMNGQNLDVGNRRNGGHGSQISIGSGNGARSLGGTGIKSSSNGYVQIVRTRTIL